jgi:hypothetical protein
MRLSSCVGETALDAGRLAYLAQPRCDLVVRDLAAGTDTVVASGLAIDHVSLRYPYAAVSYDDGKLRVYDVRGPTVVTDIDLGNLGAHSVDVNADGRVVACTTTQIAVWANPGETTEHKTGIKCDHAQQLDGDRIFATVYKRATLFDLTSGEGKPLVYGRTRYPSFGTDGERVAWADTTCRSNTANVAPLSELVDTPRAARFPHCPGVVGKVVTLKGRTASFTITCANGCTGDAVIELAGTTTDLARKAVDPKPGKPTVVKLELSARSVARLKRATKVWAAVNPTFTTGWRGGNRPLVRR